MKNFTKEGYTIRLGKTAKENWVLLENSKRHHYFFHLSSFPSGYVILEHVLEEVPESVIVECAEICKAGTKYRNLKNLKVDYCQCSNVMKGDVVGEVVFKSNRKVKIVRI
jgi:predicted ribosome quality control (RQC) complex YloA/Tae2 family protein